jgi:hypothetical protein
VTESDYGAKDITVLQGLEAVRKRPGMYFGSTGHRGLHHLVFEVLDNGVDEALAGYATEITVTLHPDGSVTVVDNGRGIPVDIMEDGSGMNAATVVDHRDRVVGVDGDVDARAIARECLVDRVVDDLVDQVMQTAQARRPDVHARTLAHRLETLEDGDVLGVICGRTLSAVLGV